MPFGKGRRWMNSGPRPVDWIIGGWQINNILTLQDGLPFTPDHADEHVEHRARDRSSRTGSRPANCRPASAPSIAGLTFRRFGAGQFTFGNSGRNILRGPGTQANRHVALQKLSVPGATARRVPGRGVQRPEHAAVQQSERRASGSAGPARITSAGSPTVYQRTSRQIQLALKVYF